MILRKMSSKVVLFYSLIKAYDVDLIVVKL